MNFLKLLFSLFLIVYTSTSLSAQNALDKNTKDIVVLVKYKVQPGKDSLAVSTLAALISKVKSEPHYMNITMHVDPFDKTNILLYERWNDEEYYKGDHMKTMHLQQFMKEAMLFLAGPPEITYWKITEY